jgi:transcriptional regulator with XRE-family HTH domain
MSDAEDRIGRCRREIDYPAGNGRAAPVGYPGAMPTTTETPGDLLREWRQRRRFSQLDLALDAEVSTRHLSFVESGRSAASRDMLLRLAETLDMPLRARNRLLVVGGFAPVYSDQPLDAPGMDAARAAVDLILKGHEPFPALAVDRLWNLLAANAAVPPLLAGAAPELLEAPVNVLRLSLHPDGLAPRIENLGEWRRHLLERLKVQVAQSGDPDLADLFAELRGYPGRADAARGATPDLLVVPLRLRMPETGAVLSLVSTTTVFGTPTDVALSELALECFYPADEETRAALAAMAGG